MPELSQLVQRFTETRQGHMHQRMKTEWAGTLSTGRTLDAQNWACIDRIMNPGGKVSATPDDDFARSAEDLAAAVAGSRNVTPEVLDAASTLVGKLFEHGEKPKFSFSEPFRANLGKTMIMLLGKCGGGLETVVDVIDRYNNSIGISRQELLATIESALPRHQQALRGTSGLQSDAAFYQGGQLTNESIARHQGMRSQRANATDSIEQLGRLKRILG